MDNVGSLTEPLIAEDCCFFFSTQGRKWFMTTRSCSGHFAGGLVFIRRLMGQTLPFKNQVKMDKVPQCAGKTGRSKQFKSTRKGTLALNKPASGR